MKISERVDQSNRSVESIVSHIKSRVTHEGSCWIWTGAKNQSGYGQLSIAGSTIKVHRFMYFSEHGDIPEGLDVSHSCHRRDCCNPNHLSAMTHKENMRAIETSGRRYSKVSENDIRLMRKLYSQGTSTRKIAREFGLSPSFTFYVVTKQSWKNVA